MRKINEIFIHHSASNWGDAKVIDKWHKENGWSGIGYHYVVLNEYQTSEAYKNKEWNKEKIGNIEKGRDLKKAGAHVSNHNANSIGVCLIHNDIPYCDTQLESYRMLVAVLAEYFDVKVENIKGHYEVDKKKPDCPGLDMNHERKIIAELIHNMPDVARDYYRIKYIEEGKK